MLSKSIALPILLICRKQRSMNIAKHKVVEIDYKLTDETGQVLDSSEGKDPLAYLHGVGAIIPGLENELEDKAAGDHIEVTVAPAEGYGERNDALRQNVPREQFKGIDDLELGMQFRVPSGSENEADQVITIVEIGEETVTVDGNHPLAGVTLNFDVKVVGVRDATAEEIEHGHAHGAGGHHH